MMRALAFKELRETMGIAGLGLAALLVVVAQNTGWQIPPGSRVSGEIPFLSGSFAGQFFVFAGLMALALGFRQSLGDFYASTYHFLLHRPISRRRLLATKLLVGLGCYAVCAALPVLLYALWADTPGTHASPFGWWMTATVWLEWFMLSTVYLAAFLCGIRPGRWFGTRLLPLAAIALTMPLGVFAPWMVAYPVVLVINGVFISLILFVGQTRDFA